MYIQDLFLKYLALYKSYPITGEDLWEYITTHWGSKLYLSEMIHREVLSFVLNREER